MKTKKFRTLIIGGRFRTTNAQGKPNKKGRFCELRKITSSESICVAQWGYGTTERVGEFTRHTPDQVVFGVSR